MKINPIINPNIVRSYQANKPALDKSKSAGKRDEVTLSEEALSFAKAMAEAKDEIEFRSAEEKAQIADLTTAVRQGEYKIDSNLVAARIFNEIG